MTETQELIKQIQVVAKGRQAAKALADKKKALYDAFQSEHAELFSDVVVATTKVGEEEARLRELTIEAYNATGNKAPVPGVSVKIFQTLDYDSKQAFDWAVDHKIMLKLDVPAFEKMSKMAPETRPGFVTITEEPRAQIASELTAP